MSIRRQLCSALLCACLAACANDREPAQQAISQISARLSAASVEAREYAPERLAMVQEQLAGLRTRFDSHDYAGVVGDAPAVLREAHELGAAAAAKKALAMAALDARWAALAAVLPADAAAIQARLDALGKSAGRRRRADPDLDAARATLSEFASTWSKGQAAFATGNMTEAVSIGERLESQYRSLAGSLQVALPPEHPQ